MRENADEFVPFACSSHDTRCPVDFMVRLRYYSGESQALLMLHCTTIAPHSCTRITLIQESAEAARFRSAEP